MSAQDRVSKDIHLSGCREQSKAETVILSEISRLFTATFFIRTKSIMEKIDNE